MMQLSIYLVTREFDPDNPSDEMRYSYDVKMAFWIARRTLWDKPGCM